MGSSFSRQHLKDQHCLPSKDSNFQDQDYKYLNKKWTVVVCYKEREDITFSRDSTEVHLICAEKEQIHLAS